MKKRIICICAVLLVVLLLIVGVSCCNGNSHNSEDGEKATASGTEQGSKPSTPEEDATEPVVQPTETDPPVIDPTEPEMPEVTPSEPEAPETNPVEPEIPEEKPSEPEVPETKPSELEKEETPEISKPVEPPKPVEYIQGNGYKRVKDFDPATNTGEVGFYMTGDGFFRVYEDEYIFEVTAGTLTYDMWCSWDTHTQMSFRSFCDLSNATIDDKYNYYRVTDFENYTCGWENHYCSCERDHQDMLEKMEQGCRYCEKTECLSFYARDESSGFTRTNSYICPEYDVRKDPSEYCQDCGLPERSKYVESGEVYCNKYLRDLDCYDCGEPVKAEKCHHCIKP